MLAQVPPGQTVRQLVPLRWRDPEQVRHWVLVDPLQVEHSKWQGSHWLLAVFSKTLLATHASGQVAPSRNLPTGQEEHWFSVAPVHSAQFPWQASQVFVAVFANFPEGQDPIHVVPSR